MNKALAGIVILILLVVGAIASVVIFNKDDNKPSDNQASTSHQASDQPLTGHQNNQNNASEQSSESIPANAVEIKDFAFGPSKITVKKGTKVTWTNQDSAKHDVKPDQESDAFKGSELLAKGESYEFTFNTVGTYSYHCSPHPYMKATVEVVE